MRYPLFLRRQFHIITIDVFQDRIVISRSEKALSLELVLFKIQEPGFWHAVSGFQAVFPIECSGRWKQQASDSVVAVVPASACHFFHSAVNGLRADSGQRPV